jgi:transglutaminase-like putative cysteine protease
MKYRITHTTYYHYSQVVGLCQNEARLLVRDFWRQQCLSSYFEIHPLPFDMRERIDYFGNRVAYFSIQQPHTHLEVTAINEVTINRSTVQWLTASQFSWEQVVQQFLAMPAIGGYPTSSDLAHNPQIEIKTSTEEFMAARYFLLDSPMITTSASLAEYALASFTPNRPILEAVQDLMTRIFTEFTYAPSSTTIATPLSDVLLYRRGVCQDFAHLAIGCLRSFGLAARYVSGYVETQPPTGQARLVGADASHAWFAVYVPLLGWIDFDPTNNKIPSDQHITLAWGRDYTDVTPLKGIALGGGRHSLTVAVDVLRLV